MVGCSFHCRLHCIICKQTVRVHCQKALFLIHLSTEHFPRSIVVCPGTLWQRLVVHFYVFALAMVEQGITDDVLKTVVIIHWLIHVTWAQTIYHRWFTFVLYRRWVTQCVSILIERVPIPVTLQAFLFFPSIVYCFKLFFIVCSFVSNMSSL